MIMQIIEKNRNLNYVINKTTCDYLIKYLFENRKKIDDKRYKKIELSIKKKTKKIIKNIKRDLKKSEKLIVKYGNRIDNQSSQGKNALKELKVIKKKNKKS